MKTQSRNNLTEMKDRRIEEKVMPLPQEPEKEFFRESEKTDTVNNKDGVYEFWWNRDNVSKGGSTLRDIVMVPSILIYSILILDRAGLLRSSG